MRVWNALQILLGRLFVRLRSVPAVRDRGPAAPSGDDTVVVSPSQAVTISIERPPAMPSPDLKSRKPLPWPARDTSRQQRNSARDDGGLQTSCPPDGDAEGDDITVVIVSAGKDEPKANPDDTVVWRPDDSAGRQPS